MDQKEPNMYVPTYNILISNHHVYYIYWDIEHFNKKVGITINKMSFQQLGGGKFKFGLSQ